MFHHFHGAGHAPGQGSIAEADLALLIEVIGPRRILPAERWLADAIADRLRPGDVCLTFDDNLRCQHDVALPVLRRFGLTAFWFVATATFTDVPPTLEIHRAFRERCFASLGGFYAAFDEALARSAFAEEARCRLASCDVNKYLAEFPFYSHEDRRFRFVRDEVLGPRRFDELMSGMMRDAGADKAALACELWMTPESVCRLRSEGHVIGLHTHTHPTRVGRLVPADQLREYRDNYMMLMELLGTPPLAMAHPCNSYDAATLAILRRLGVRVGFRANMVLHDHGPLEWPREDHSIAVQRARCLAAPPGLDEAETRR